MTRSSASGWCAGVTAFLLPALLAMVGLRLDRSSIRNAPAYAALIPVAVLSGVALAAIVPSILIARIRRPRPQRVGLIIGMLCLLALECAATVFIVLMAGLR